MVAGYAVMVAGSSCVAHHWDYAVMMAGTSCAATQLGPCSGGG
jgi:hypothetical protein